MPYIIQWVNQFSQLGETSVDAVVTDTDKVLPDQRMNLIFRKSNIDAAFLNSQTQAVINVAMSNLPSSGVST